MRTFELRVYKLRTKEALDFYTEQPSMLTAAGCGKDCGGSPGVRRRRLRD